MVKLHGSYSECAKFSTAILLILSVLFFPSAMFAVDPHTTTAQGEDVAEYRRFLEEKYDIRFAGTITKGQFMAGVATLLNLPMMDENRVKSDQALTQSVAVSIAVRAAGLQELAATYSTAKVNHTLRRLQMHSDALGIREAQELAVAVDTDMLPSSLYTNFKPNDAADEQLVYTLLGKILAMKGLYKQYIGHLNDPDIYSKLISAYRQSNRIEAPKLQKLMNKAMELQLITGYSVKDTRYDSNFIPALSLVYGHSDVKHMVQIIGLLRSEGLRAKVQMEPKTSAYILREQDEPDPNAIPMENGGYITYAKEYDLKFEFATEKDKAAFHRIVSTYATIDEQDESGLIYGSWWQPLYYSTTELQHYEAVTNNIIEDEESPYYVNTFTRNDDSMRVVEGLLEIDPDVAIHSYPLWIDKPIYDYLHGEASY